jgi:hypothetical protein
MIVAMIATIPGKIDIRVNHTIRMRGGKRRLLHILLHTLSPNLDTAFPSA